MHPEPGSFACFHLGSNGFINSSSVGKGSACNTGDLGLILRLGRSAREGTGYPLQYSCALPVAQLVKNQPASQEICV